MAPEANVRRGDLGEKIELGSETQELTTMTKS